MGWFNGRMAPAEAFLKHLRRSVASDFFSPAGYFFLGWIVVYVAIGIFVYARENRRAGRASFSFRSAIVRCFPSRAFSGPSARLDFQILLFSHYLLTYPIGLYLWTNQDKVANGIAPHVSRALSIFGTRSIPATNGFVVDFLYTILVLAIADLGWTIQHLLFHRVPRLWEFHKVHHSATELNLFTISRLHPVDVLTQAWFAGAAVGILMGLMKFGFGTVPSVVFFLNVSWAMALFRVLGIFRHSPVWISFGPVGSRIFSSPAMHHVHHSADERHFNKNFAVVFSFWDALFGTLFIPEARESLRFGIDTPDSDPRKYDTLLGGLIHPFLPHEVVERHARWRVSRKSRRLRSRDIPS